MRRHGLPLPIACGLVLASPAHAHLEAATSPGAPGPTDAALIAPLLLLSLAHLAGTRQVRRRSRSSREPPVAAAAAFHLGLAALAVALLSPLERAAATSFAAHMAQHVLLAGLVAPLLALGRPRTVLLALPSVLRWRAPRPIRARLRRVTRRLGGLPVATAAHGVALWAWHAPGLYEAALAEPAIHLLEHATLLGTGLLFWWSVRNARGREPLGDGAAVAALFLTTMHMGMLGILVTLAPVPLYATYEAIAPDLESALVDQHLAGIVMLVPGGLAYLIAGLWLLKAWLDAAGRRRTAALAPRVAWPREP